MDARSDPLAMLISSFETMSSPVTLLTEEPPQQNILSSEIFKSPSSRNNLIGPDAFSLATATACPASRGPSSDRTAFLKRPRSSQEPAAIRTDRPAPDQLDKIPDVMLHLFRLRIQFSAALADSSADAAVCWATLSISTTAAFTWLIPWPAHGTQPRSPTSSETFLAISPFSPLPRIPGRKSSSPP